MDATLFPLIRGKMHSSFSFAGVLSLSLSLSLSLVYGMPWFCCCPGAAGFCMPFPIKGLASSGLYPLTQEGVTRSCYSTEAVVSQV
jgi:hypothetical protein